MSNQELKECLEEACALMEDVYRGDYTPDGFTTQPWRIALKGNGWISVEDQLPMTDSNTAGWSPEVLVLRIGGTMEVDTLFWYKSGGGLSPSRWLRSRHVDSVTHWMKLPEPPQEASDD